MGYSHGGGIDRPVTVFRGGTPVVPYVDWRGTPAIGSYTDGSATTGACPPFPAGRTTVDGEKSGEPCTEWWGSLIAAQTDGSGLEYMRNRYYDPRTGRFTQEDPIGLAGGLNLYGFAAGDPVNFDDPFGLCEPLCTILDIAFLAADINDIRKNGITWGSGLALAADLGGVLLPFVPAVVGATHRAARGVRAGTKVPLPRLKDSPFGPKIGDEIPNGVPRNWSGEQIEDAIVDYQTSIASRKAEMAAFDAVGGGSAKQRLDHAQRISQEEAFLKSLEKAQRDRW
jgi:RHS repeat-associated protein